MPAYVISELQILDEKAAAEYRRLAAASIAEHGGRYLARGVLPWVQLVSRRTRLATRSSCSSSKMLVPSNSLPPISSGGRQYGLPPRSSAHLVDSRYRASPAALDQRADVLLMDAQGRRARRP